MVVHLPIPLIRRSALSCLGTYLLADRQLAVLPRKLEMPCESVPTSIAELRMQRPSTIREAGARIGLSLRTHYQREWFPKR